MKRDLWVIQHSKRQGEFQIDTLDVVLKANLDALLQNTDADRDYVLVGIATSHEDAHELLKRLKQQIAEGAAKG